MPESRLWILNHIGTAFTIGTNDSQFTRLKNTGSDAVTVKRVSANDSCAWAIGHDHRVYIYVFSSDVPIRVPDTTFENQRWTPIHGFSRKSLIPTDRNAWSDKDGKGDRPKESVRLPSSNWQWEGDWFIDDNLRGEVVGIEGWQYAFDFPSVYSPEKHWNSFVRKRKWIRFRRFMAVDTWARISDMEVNDKGECFIDISVGGFLMPTQVPGSLSVWGVTNNGNIFVRTNVQRDNPEGVSWHEIEMNKENGVIDISVGVSNLVWAVTWDGNALVRTNVTRTNIYGEDWQRVGYPNEMTRLMQVAVGHNAVWALSREGKVWFRKGTWGDDMYGNTESAIGTMWVEMVGEMMHIAVSANDQVFAIDKNTKDIVFRTSVSRSDLTGKTWQTLSLQEDLSSIEREGRLSAGFVCSCYDDESDFCDYHGDWRRNSSPQSEISISLYSPQIDDSIPCDSVVSFTEINDKRNTLPYVESHSHSNPSTLPIMESIPSHDIPSSSEITTHDAKNQTIDIDSSLSHISSSIYDNSGTAHNSVNAVHSDKHKYSSDDAIENKEEVKESTLVSENDDKISNDKNLDQGMGKTKADEEQQLTSKEPKKALKHKSGKKSHKRLECVENSSSSIVFQEKKGKKKHKHKQNKSESGVTHGKSGSEKAADETERMDNDDFPSLNSNEPESIDGEVNFPSIVATDHSVQIANEINGTDGCTETFHCDNINGNSNDDIKDHVQETLSFLSKDSICVKGEKNMDANQANHSVKEIIANGGEISDNKTLVSENDFPEVDTSSEVPLISYSSSATVQNDAVAKSSKFINVHSASFDSSASDEIIDFVTDLMSDEEDRKDVFIAQETTKNTTISKDNKGFISNENEKGSKIIKLTSSVSCPVSSVKETEQENMLKQNNSFSASNQRHSLPLQHSDNNDRPFSQLGAVTQAPSFFSYRQRPPSTNFDSSCSESSSSIAPLSVIEQAHPRLSWKWLDVTSCFIENPSSVSWLAAKSQGSSSRSKKPPKISFALRNDILEKLKSRNKRESQAFADIDQAVEKKTWVKCTKMHFSLYGRHNRWLSCNVELEQDISNSVGGCLTIHYYHKLSQKRIQVNHNEIMCVKMSSNPDDQSTFFIYSTICKERYQPLKLRAGSEAEASEWVTCLCLMNARLWNIDRTICPGVAWSCTLSGDVFVSIDISCDNPSSDLCWTQHGGHMSLIETGASGVTWALGFDQMPYVYNRGYGRAVSGGETRMSDNLQEIIDFDRVYVYENQKWFPVVGWCSKGVLSDNFHWLTQSGKSVASRNDIKLPTTKWQWISDWVVDFNSPGGVNSSGWQFSTSLYGHFHSNQQIRDCFRRRRWTRTCRLTTQGPWQSAGSIKLLDIAIDPVSSSTESVLLWAVGANGDVLCRNGVTTACPEGESWNHVATFLDKPFRSISVGGDYRVWGIASDGSAWFRAGVSPHNQSGKCWLQVVPPPPGNDLLKQVSAGASTVWAVDTGDNLWRRENITPTFPEGTGWENVESKVKQVSVGPEDQVWIVADAGFSRQKHGAGVIYKRVGINEKHPSGMKWEIVIGSGWSYVTVRGMAKNLNIISANEEP